MHINVNGKTIDYTPGLSVDALLKTLGYKDHFVAVAVNSEVVLRRNYLSHQIQAADEIEILAPMAGG